MTARASESDSDVQGDASSASFESPLISGNGTYVVFDTNANNLISGGTIGGRAGIFSTNPLFEENIVNLMTGISLTTVAHAQNSLTRLTSYENEITNLKGVIGGALDKNVEFLSG